MSALPSVEELVESRPELFGRIRAGEPAALCEFFELRGATVVSFRYVEEGS